MARTGFDPSTYSSATADYTLGVILEYAGNHYRYLLNSDAATANGDCMHYTATVTTQRGGTAPTVNNRLIASGGTPASVSNNCMAGIAVGVVAASQYGWFLVRGYHAAVKCEAGVNAGDVLKASAATDLRVTVVSAATHAGQGMALTTVAANLIQAEIWI
jgi:hypothetical protein